MLSVWHKADIYRIPIYAPVTSQSFPLTARKRATQYHPSPLTHHSITHATFCALPASHCFADSHKLQGQYRRPLLAVDWTYEP